MMTLWFSIWTEEDRMTLAIHIVLAVGLAIGAAILVDFLPKRKVRHKDSDAGNSPEGRRSHSQTRRTEWSFTRREDISID